MTNDQRMPKPQWRKPSERALSLLAGSYVFSPAERAGTANGSTPPFIGCRRIGHWSVGIGHSLVIGYWSLVIILNGRPFPNAPPAPFSL